MNDPKGIAAAIIVALASAWLSACGACWPGSCADEPGPTTCTCDVTLPAVSASMWEVPLDPANPDQGCPRILLSTTMPVADTSNLCEVGVADVPPEATPNPSPSPGNFFRFNCNEADPWQLSFVSIANNILTLSADCGDPNGYTRGTVLAAQEQSDLQSQFDGLVEDFDQECTASCPEACTQFCAGEISFAKALDDLDITTTERMDCYLRLFENADDFPQIVPKFESDGDELVAWSQCACPPTANFLDCVAATCFADGEYDADCGQSCYNLNPSTQEGCTATPTPTPSPAP